MDKEQSSEGVNGCSKKTGSFNDEQNRPACTVLTHTATPRFVAEEKQESALLSSGSTNDPVEELAPTPETLRVQQTPIADITWEAAVLPNKRDIRQRRNTFPFEANEEDWARLIPLSFSGSAQDDCCLESWKYLDLQDA